MLPRLEVPTYTLTLPSTKAQVVFRPFLVNEHRQLMMVTGSDAVDQLRVVKDLIRVCTFEKLNVDKLPNFDIEYIFLNLRAKSINETVKLVVTCECGHQQDASVDLTSVAVNEAEGHTNKISLTDTIGIQMKYPTGDDIAEIRDSATMENTFKLMTNCIGGVYDQQNYWSMEDQTPEEIETFISSLTKAQFDKIENFFITMPVLSHTLKFKCESCGLDNEVMMRGLASFFA